MATSHRPPACKQPRWDQHLGRGHLSGRTAENTRGGLNDRFSLVPQALAVTATAPPGCERYTAPLDIAVCDVALHNPAALPAFLETLLRSPAFPGAPHYPAARELALLIARQLTD